LLELRSATKSYGPVHALDDVSLAVRSGRILGLLGPNGAGKTTAMRAMFGLVRLERGGVFWNGKSVAAADRARFGYMPEERGLYPKMRVRDQLTYFARLHGLGRSNAARAVDAWLAELGLTDRSLDKVETLSHGNQQRVQLAAALVHQPEVLVLDEPFSGLDPIGVETMEGVVRRRAAEGAAVVFSSHQLDLVEGLVDDVVIINRGRVVLDGEVGKVRASARFRRLDVVFEGSRGAWPPAIEGVELIDRKDGLLRLRVAPEVDLESLLSSARAAGEVTRFSYQPPGLSEIFKDAVRP